MFNSVYGSEGEGRRGRGINSFTKPTSHANDGRPYFISSFTQGLISPSVPLPVSPYIAVLFPGEKNLPTGGYFCLLPGRGQIGTTPLVQPRLLKSPVPRRPIAIVRIVVRESLPGLFDGAA